jgi:hypothetical protein
MIPSPRRRPLLAATVFAGAVLALGCSDSCGKKAAKVVPVLEKVNPDYGEPELACEPAFATPSPTGCAIQTLTCGDQVEGNTSAGRFNWGDDFYQKAFCTPQRHDYDDSPESIYMLKIPGDVQADVRLESPCADLDLVAVGWSDAQVCPTIAHTIRIVECEMGTASGSDTVRMTTVNKGQSFLIGVDGKNGATGNYRLTVKCSTYR